MAKHPELLIQLDGTSRGRRLELPQDRGCERYDYKEGRGTDGEQSATHRPAGVRGEAGK
jgi:hypothetical protein